MKVAIVCPYAFERPGGVQDQVARLVRWLGAAGHTAWAVAPGKSGPDGTRHVGRFMSFRANRSRAPLAFNPAVIGRVRRAAEDADVVHIHEPFVPMVSLGALLARTPPKVGTFHADPGRIARMSYRGLAIPVRRLTGRLGVATAVSEVAAGPLRRLADLEIIPNGIDVDDYRLGLPRAEGTVVFVGRDDPRKGLDLLLAAWPRVREVVPTAELTVLGPEQPSGTPGVEFLGWVADAEKRRRLAGSEILVAPNRGGESFGLVVLEGLAAGCAVVASDLTAFRAVADDAALYVPIGDVSALSRSLAGLLEDHDRVASMSQRGQRRSESFDRERVLPRYLGAYEEAIAASS